MINHYYALEDNCVNRLLDEHKKHGTLYIAFDFDNTIYDYHDKGIDCSSVISLLQNCTKLGFKMILFTCEDDINKLKEKETFCFDNMIEVHYINESPILDFTTKPYYNILLDDRAGLESSMKILERVVTHLKI